MTVLRLRQLFSRTLGNNCYVNQGEVPERIILGETSDISTFAEHAWFSRSCSVIQQLPFRSPKRSLVSILVQIDVGPAMTADILHLYHVFWNLFQKLAN